MLYRELQESDKEQIVEIFDRFHKPDFGFSFSDSIISAVVVDDNDKVIGCSLIRPIYESILILDTERPTRDKIETLQLLVTNGMFECAKRGIEQVHAFVQSSGFTKLLKKQFGFQTVKGEAIVKLI